MTTPTSGPITARRADSALLRRIWRLHFWVGLFAAPVLLVLACTGLVILYSEPIDTLLNRNLLVVEQSPGAVSLDQQIATAAQHVGPAFELDGVTPPKSLGRSTQIDFLDPGAPSYPHGERAVTQVFVDPHTGAYLGRRAQLSGVVGLANQLHRMFGNDGPTVELPALGHLINPAGFPDATIAVGVFNLWMELTATWILVLLASGVYLWWPRAIEATKPMFALRWGKGGRVRWRDLHALVGVVMAAVLIGYILSGTTWTRYWGENWRAFSTTVTPGQEVDAPSTPATLGQYDRLGRRIAWADNDDPIYASQPGALAARLSYDDIDRIAKDEQMLPGYTIFGPADFTDAGITTYGSFTVANHWPQRLSEQRTLYIDQFSGQTLANATAAQDGTLARATSFGIAMHMGNQVGVWTRILATMACLGVLTSVSTGLLMWWRRRPAGGTGLPGPASPGTRIATPKRARVVIAILAVALGVLYPVFGVSLLVVLGVEAVLGLRRASRQAIVAVSDDDADEVPVGVLR